MMATKYKCRNFLTVANGTKYNPGDVIDLSGEDLTVALSFGAVVPVEVETPQTETKTPETPKTEATTTTESKPAETKADNGGDTPTTQPEQTTPAQN